MSDPSASNDEGITALHNAICAGHFEIVKFLVEFGCNVNSPDSDGWYVELMQCSVALFFSFLFPNTVMNISPYWGLMPVLMNNEYKPISTF